MRQIIEQGYAAGTQMNHPTVTKVDDRMMLIDE